jgi:hypothetical protein
MAAFTSPRADMDEFGYDVGSLALRKEDAAFRALMEFEADRARNLYASAERCCRPADRRSMVAAEIMRAVYSYSAEKDRPRQIPRSLTDLPAQPLGEDALCISRSVGLGLSSAEPTAPLPCQ